jgi:hypothetical protein
MNHPDFSKYFFSVVVGLFFAPSAHAGPPFVTDDPEPVAYQTWEVNYALTGTRDKRQTFAFLPSIDANYGASPSLQLHIQPQIAYNSRSHGATYGLGDTEVGIKYRLTPESDSPEDWMISIYPLYVIPTGSANRKLGAGAPSVYLPIWLQTTRDVWTTYGGGGYWVNSGGSNKNTWAAGWAALYQFTEKLQFGGEVFAKTTDTTNGRSSSGINLGGTYGLVKDYNLLFSAGHGLTNVASTNQASAYFGLQVIY